MGKQHSTLESMVVMDLTFYKGKTVLITGHTGFKGSWMSRVLHMLGAYVIGYSLNPKTKPNLFDMDGYKCVSESVIGDIRDLEALRSTMIKYNPEIVIHMAAQPLVRDSYDDPVYTYDVNVMGTVNILESIRNCESVKSFVNVTTDKVYKNNEWEWGYRENEELDGYDPYSNSKSCSELVTGSFKRSFFKDRDCAISTLRAGNVIGGGDFAKDRIIPDCVRAVQTNSALEVRNPYSTRPYQHVLEPVYAYLLVAMIQYEELDCEGIYNIGPDDNDCVSTRELVELFKSYWGSDFVWIDKSEKNAPHEANFLKLDCSKIKKVFGWQPKYNIKEAIQKTVEWTKEYIHGNNIERIMTKQIEDMLLR